MSWVCIIKEISREDMIDWMWCPATVQNPWKTVHEFKANLNTAPNINLAWRLTIIHQGAVKCWVFTYLNFVGVSKISLSRRSEGACKIKSKSGLSLLWHGMHRNRSCVAGSPASPTAEREGSPKPPEPLCSHVGPKLIQGPDLQAIEDTYQ